MTAALRIRPTTLQVSLLAAWLLNVICAVAAADARGAAPWDLWVAAGRFGVLHAVGLASAWKYRGFLSDIYDACVGAHLQYVVMAMIGMVAGAIVLTLSVTQSVKYALMFVPALWAAQAALAVFACAGRGFDRLLWTGMCSIVLQAATGSPRTLLLGVAFVGVGVFGLVWSHAHALIERHDRPEPPAIPGLWAAAALAAGIAALAMLGVAAVLPRNTGLPGGQIEANSGGGGGGAGASVRTTDGFNRKQPGGLGGLIGNALALAAGAALGWFVWQRWRKRSGPDDDAATADADGPEIPVTALPDFAPRPTGPPAPARTPRGQVIVQYNALVDGLRPHGLSRRASDTPAEYAATLTGRGAPQDPVARLTALFAVAKYSTDDVSREQVAEAGALVDRIITACTTKPAERQP